MFDTKELQKLIKAKQWEKAKTMLNEHLNAPISEEEKGAAYVAFVTTYISLMNRLGGEYEKALDDAIASVRIIDKDEVETNNSIDLARVHNQIENLKKGSR